MSNPNNPKPRSLSNETDSLIPTSTYSTISKKDSFRIEITELEDYNDQISSSDNPFRSAPVKEYWTQVYKRNNYEGRHHFDPDFSWDKQTEDHLVNKLDYKVTLLACVAFASLQIDRANISQAITDNFLGDLNLTNEDYNTGNTISKIAFLIAEIPSGLIAKKVGVDIWIPCQMILWSVVAISQGFIKDKYGFYLTRALIAILEGGFIPQIVLWLSYFFRSDELSLRVSYLWCAMSVSQIVNGIFAWGLLRLRGLFGLPGWSWLFMIEGAMTLIVGVASFLLMVPSAVETQSWLYPDGWLSYDEEKIVINRTLRDDPSKGDMNNRQHLTLKALVDAISDFDLWPVYGIGLIIFIPVDAVANYLTLNLKQAGFDNFTVNLLTLPFNLFHILGLVGITKLSEYLNERSFVSLIAPLSMIPPLLVLIFTENINKWSLFITLTVAMSQPYIHAINISWVSKNSNSIKTRAISAALYNMFVQLGSAIGANIYHSLDAPKYVHGNTNLLYISVVSAFYLIGVKFYYWFRNHQKNRIWERWTEEQREIYVLDTGDQGNKRLDFRFSH